jgi:hypothetical protein
MKKLLFVLVSLFAANLAWADPVAKGGKAPPAVHTTPADQSWVQPYGPQGPSFSFVQGKFGDKKPCSFFLKMSPGSDSGWHIHSQDYVAAVISGNFTEQQQGEAAESKLPAGSYFAQTGKKNHRNGCEKDGGDCVVFVHMEKGADSIQMTPEGKTLPKAHAAK